MCFSRAETFEMKTVRTFRIVEQSPYFKILKRKYFNFDRSTLTITPLQFFCILRCFSGLHNSTLYLKEPILCSQNSGQYSAQTNNKIIIIMLLRRLNKV